MSERVVIDWGSNPIAWHQWYGQNVDKDKEVLQIQSVGYVQEWSGYLDFYLDCFDLVRLINNPFSNNQWKEKLASIGGVYLIQNSMRGDLHVGSASGDDGIWGRWSQYAQNGQGENKVMIKNCLGDSNYKNNYIISLLHVLPKHIGNREIIEYESLYKRKLGEKSVYLRYQLIL